MIYHEISFTLKIKYCTSYKILKLAMVAQKGMKFPRLHVGLEPSRCNDTQKNLGKFHAFL